jgi:hypothetical protein
MTKSHEDKHTNCPFTEEETRRLIVIANEQTIRMPRWMLPILVTVLLAAFSGAFAVSGYNHGLIANASEERHELRVGLEVLKEATRTMAERQSETNELLKVLVRRSDEESG